jgi:D-beta-D-heptose 7-phosphate kinase/D-beta-D-heptose 1-phosphate adenosyltransferase
MSPRLFSEQLRNAKPRIWVLGDVMLDRYLIGHVERVSPEAPVPVLALLRIEDKAGGAANVAQNLIALGAEVALAGRVGDDEAASALRGVLSKAGVRTAGLVCEPGAVTTVKQRALAGQQQLLRIDSERTNPMGADSQSACLTALAQELPAPQLIILSDYGKGVVTRALVEELLQRYPQTPIFVDPKGRDYSKYRGTFLITPNEQEAALAAGLPISDNASLLAASERLGDLLPSTAILVTQGARGMSLRLPPSVQGSAGQTSKPAALIHSPAQARQVFDVTGAGDTALAALAVSWAAGLQWSEMLQVANVAAGIKVGQVGAVPVALSEIIAALHEHEGKILGRGQLAELRQRLAQAGERLVFTNGCFDVLHIGHLRLLERSRQLGDRLLVAINSDDSVRRLKGPSRPLNREADRAAMLAALDCVDFVTVFEEDTPKEAILECRPDVLVKGGDYTLDTVVGAAEVQGWGGQVELIPLVAGQSSTRLIESM